MKRSQIVIIVVLAILTCVSPSVVSAEIPPFQWVKIGVAPYNPNGKVELDLAAVTEFVRKGELSQDEGAEFATLIRASRFEKSSLHRGRFCRAMLSRDKKLDKPVETAWEHYQAVDAKLYKLVNGLELYVVDRCGNPLICDAEEKTKEALPAKAAEPKPAPPVAVREARVGVIPSTAAIPQFRLIVSLFADREDHFFRNRYNAAKQQPSNKTAYRRAVLEFGHKELIQERRSRSLAKGTFNLFVFDGAGKQIATDQLVTDVKGQALYKMPPEFASVRVVPDHALRDIIPQEGAIHATMEQFQVVWKDWKSATMEVFFIQAEGLDRPGQ